MGHVVLPPPHHDGGVGCVCREDRGVGGKALSQGHAPPPGEVWSSPRACCEGLFVLVLVGQKGKEKEERRGYAPGTHRSPRTSTRGTRRTTSCCPASSCTCIQSYGLKRGQGCVPGHACG